MTNLFEKFLGPRPPRPVSLQELHRRRAQINQDKAVSAAKKKSDADEAKAKSQAQAAQRKQEKTGVQARLQNMWDRYAQTSASQVVEDAYLTLASFPQEKGDDHTNNLERVQIEDSKEGAWVGERLQWEWYVERWAFFKEPYKEGKFRLGKPLPIHWKDVLRSRVYKGKSVSVRYYGDGHIEVIGGSIVKIGTQRRSEDDIIKDLDDAIGKALRKPRLD